MAFPMSLPPMPASVEQLMRDESWVDQMNSETGTLFNTNFAGTEKRASAGFGLWARRVAQEERMPIRYEREERFDPFSGLFAKGDINPNQMSQIVRHTIEHDKADRFAEVSQRTPFLPHEDMYGFKLDERSMYRHGNGEMTHLTFWNPRNPSDPRNQDSEEWQHGWKPFRDGEVGMWKDTQAPNPDYNKQGYAPKSIGHDTRESDQVRDGTWKDADPFHIGAGQHNANNPFAHFVDRPVGAEPHGNVDGSLSAAQIQNPLGRAGAGQGAGTRRHMDVNRNQVDTTIVKSLTDLSNFNIGGFAPKVIKEVDAEGVLDENHVTYDQQVPKQVLAPNPNIAEKTGYTIAYDNNHVAKYDHRMVSGHNDRTPAMDNLDTFM